MANVSSFSGAMPVIPGGTVEVARLSATNGNSGVSIVQNFASASNLFSTSATVIGDGSTAYLVEVFVPLIYSTAGSFQGRVSLVNGTSEYGRLVVIDTVDGFQGNAQYGQMVVTPSSGTTLSLNARIWRGNANAGLAFYGDGTGSNYVPASLRVSKIVNQNDGLKPFWTPPVVTQLPSQATVGDQVVNYTTNGAYQPYFYTGATDGWKQVGTSKPPMVGCAATALQSIPNNAWTSLNFGASDLFDTDSMHNPSSNNTRITFNTAGVYIVEGSSMFASNGTGIRGIGISKNGGALMRTVLSPAISSSGIDSEITLLAIASFAVNDYIELQVYQSSGGALNTSFRDSRPAFAAAWQGPTS